MARSELARVEAPGAVLAGTLHQPAGAGPHPAMVMLQGSGVADRESGGFFPPIRAALLDAGVGVLSWDKPGVGESSGDWRERTLFDRADEALAAIAWLREHPAVDAGRVGIWGHSQGGWVGPLTVSRATDPAFLVINSGPGIGVDDQDLYGVEQTLRAAGRSDVTIRVYPGADHRIRIGEPFQFADGYLEGMSAWVAARAGVAA